MIDDSLQAARRRLHAKSAALIAITVMTLVLAALVFILSFDAQRQLILEIGVKPEFAWMAPVALDITTTAALLGLTVLADDEEFNSARVYCKRFAIATVALSVAGNGYHAFGLANVRVAQTAAGMDVGYDPQPAEVAAFIAMIAPFLFLALTHFLTLMLGAIVNERARYLRVVAEHLQREKESAEQSATVDGRSHAPTDVLPDGYNELAAPTSDPWPTIAPIAYAFDPDEEAGETLAPGHDALPAAIASELEAMHELHAPAATTRNGYEQTESGLQAFLVSCNLRPQEKEVAALLLDRPDLTYAQVAGMLPDEPVESTVCRRWHRFKDAAMNEGFDIPPLPRMPFTAATAAGTEELSVNRELLPV
ncbi:DUF2637 domain-containing protein [Rhodococcus koreensis]|uniref:DUF2637 domain-containing protein n=1 Tax=Rhodococcus koreensis TaxID=99653 RepID=A0A1H4I4Z0_9NOCA|nr:DUF2637 domain-containing protein [Rhodococcus koreensis]SEB29154.1 Protein of unknown function [Rhodococcus koreensis]